MIKRESLRVNNLVNVVDNDFICSIDKIDKGFASVNKDSNTSIVVKYSDISGVPLTKEIIELLGWKWVKDIRKEKLNMPFIIAYCKEDNKLYALLGEYHILLTFVHELQNVYYMVEKKELNVSKLYKK